MAQVRFVLAHDVSTIHRQCALPSADNCARLSASPSGPLPAALPETGLVALNLLSRPHATREFVRVWSGYYGTRLAYADDCLNDICVYSRLMHRPAPHTVHSHAVLVSTRRTADLVTDRVHRVWHRHWPAASDAVREAALLADEASVPMIDEAAVSALLWEEEEEPAREWARATKYDTNASGKSAPQLRALELRRRLERRVIDYLNYPRSGSASASAAAGAGGSADSRLRIREGWFSTCPEAYRPAKQEQRRRMAGYYVPPGLALVCPGASAAASPFHLFDYISHAKGSIWEDGDAGSHGCGRGRGRKLSKKCVTSYQRSHPFADFGPRHRQRQGAHGQANPQGSNGDGLRAACSDRVA